MFSMKEGGDNVNNLKELRKEKGLTFKELSQSLRENNVNISPDSLAKYERGERKPKYDKWVGIASFYGVSVPYLQGNTFSKREIFRIISKGYVSNDSYGFLAFNLDAHVAIFGLSQISKLFTVKELQEFTPNVEKFFNNNFQFVFLTASGKEMLMTEKNTGYETIMDIQTIFSNVVSDIDDKLLSTPISNTFDKLVDDNLTDFYLNRDFISRTYSKQEIIQSINELEKSFNQFKENLSSLPENKEIASSDKAKKRLKKFIDSGGKSFE